MTVVVCVSPRSPPTPVVVIVYVPVGVVELVVTVKTDEFPVVAFGAYDAVAPAGRPEAVRFSGPRKPP